MFNFLIQKTRDDKKKQEKKIKIRITVVGSCITTKKKLSNIQLGVMCKCKHKENKMFVHTFLYSCPVL